MPVPSPILDDRSYQQLRDELVGRISVYTPEWTDFNASDPGITLVELFAFLGENLLFRFNQIPEATRLAFLRLLQIPLRPESPARAMLAFSTEAPDGALVPQESEADAGNLPFETRTEVVVWPVSMLAVARAAAPAPDAQAEPEAFEFAVRALDAVGTLAPDQEPVYYENQIVSADGTGLPVDFTATVDGMLWVAVLAGDGADKSKLGAALLNFGFVPDPVVPSIDQATTCPGAGVTSTAPAVEWQVSTRTLNADGAPVYNAIAVEGDTSSGLTQRGVVRLRLPRDPAAFGMFAISDPDLSGTGQFPPALDDATNAKVLFWLRAFRRDGTRFGKVQFVAANAAEAVQQKKAQPEFVGTGNGQPNQQYKLVHPSLVAGSLVIEVEELSGFQPWTSVDSFYASGPDDRHYVVDLEAGTVEFGNGIQGYPPQIGQRIRATEYRFSQGATGNVAAKAINAVTGLPPGTPPVTVVNPLAAQGGQDAESIDAGLNRIPGELRRRDRAVTAGDFQELALQTPGVHVARAECLPRFDPHNRGVQAAGVVSVVVWPADDARNPNAPLPDRNILRAVCQWLDQRRLVTTELYVIPPTYRKVAVAVGLQAKPGFGIEAVRRWVELVLRQYLAPLPPYGPTGQGWPLGRRVYGPELEAAALQVEGVEFLEGLNVAGWDAATATWVPGTVELNIWEVPDLAVITVVDGLPGPAGASIEPPAPVSVPLPVPVIREEC
jgi:hypothetical protein